MRAVVYVRVSTEEQAKEGFSLEAQRDRCISCIESQGYQLMKVYIDDGVSAKNMNRPKLQELMEDCKKKLFNLVVVYKLDRLTRSVMDSQVILQHFEKHGVKFKSTMEEFETITAGGRMFLNLMTVIAQWEREQIAERVTLGMSKRAELGLRNSFKMPLGYKRGDNDNLVIDEEKAEITRLMFEMYASGKGVRRIQQELTHRGYRGQRGAYIAMTTIYDMLVNPVFTGTTRWKPKDAPEIVTENTHPAIVSKELFDRVQHILKRKKNKEISRSSYNYAFSGILKCGHCGANMNGHTTKKKLVSGEYKEYRSYHCFAKHNLTKCSIPDITERKVEELFFSELVHHLRFELSREIFEAAEVNKVRDDPGKLRKSLEKKIAESRKIIDNWAYAMGKGAMQVDQYVRLSQQEEANIERLQRELGEIREENTIKANYEEAIEWLINLQQVWADMNMEDRKRSVQLMFKRIEICHTDGVWKITNHEFDT